MQKILGDGGEEEQREKAVRNSGRGGRGKNKKARAVGSVAHWIRNVPKGTVVCGARSSIGKQPSTDYSLVCHPVLL